jgi:DNA-directed RNA polymerase subunit RPC12/RpoP
MKTNKHQTLLLVEKKGGVRARDLVNAFSYTSGTARSYLSYLARQGLLTRTAPGYVLTERGQARLEFFAVTGCDQVECPLCEGKAGYVTCPLCGFRLHWNDARLRPERNFVLVRRPAGVHCPRCLSVILTEDRARLVGITAEAK